MYEIKNFLKDKYERINSIINNEYNTITNYACMIGSANYPFPSVMEALSLPFQQNPNEGSRNHRYFPHANSIDELEVYGEELIHRFFDNYDYHTNIEAYSGTQANQIVYNAVLEKGDIVLSLDSKSGGHISHQTFLKKYYTVLNYNIDVDGKIDYSQIEKLCIDNSPKLIIAGYSSYPRQVDYKIIGDICNKYGVYLLADISHTVLYIANKCHISPLGYADFITFTTHKTTRGIRGGVVMCKKHFQKKIDSCTFPLIQGAPKFNEILAKVIMFEELLHMDISQYVSKIMEISLLFVNKLKKNNIKMYTDGTDSHLILLDLRDYNITGKQCEELLEKQHILVNRNSIPNDNQSPIITSGIRLGTLCLATLNFTLEDCEILSDIIVKTIINKNIGNVDIVPKLMSKYKVIQ